MAFLLFNQAILPPGFQAFTGLDNVFRQCIPLRCDELFGTTKHSFVFCRHCWAAEGIKGVLEKGREVIWPGHSCPPLDRIKSLSVFARSTVGVVIDLGFGRVVAGHPVPKREDLLLWWFSSS